MIDNARILIISHNCFSKVYNNGKTLESFFSEFRKENLAQLFFVQDDTIDFDYCDDYFKITDADVLRKVITGCSKCGSVIDQKKETNTTIDNSFLNVHRSTIKKSKYLTIFRDLLWETRAWKTKELKDWCCEINPDVIFYTGGNLKFSHTIALYISKILDKPMVTYFTDDYLIYPKNRNIFDYIQQYRMKQFYRKTIERSSALYAIGDLMVEEYSKYFGKKFISIMNSVPVQPYLPYKNTGKINISYFGGLHLSRWQMIVRLAKLLDNRKNININVYTVSKPDEKIMLEFDQSGITYKGKVVGSDLHNAILESDILLHVESDDTYYKSLTRLSVSTKIPEYLISGRLVLGYGPVDVASMRLLFDNGIGEVISSSSADSEVQSKLEQIVNDYEYRRCMGMKGYQFAVNKFDKVTISKQLKENIISLICSKEKHS